MPVAEKQQITLLAIILGKLPNRALIDHYQGRHCVLFRAAHCGVGPCYIGELTYA